MSTEADIVEELRAEVGSKYQNPNMDWMLLTAISEIEKLRAERDAAYDDLRALWATDQSSVRICEHCDAWLTTDEAARVDDISLCPQEAYGGIKFPNEKCFKHRAWLIQEDRKATSAIIATDGKDAT